MTVIRTARVVGFRCDGDQISAVEVACPYCGGRHHHIWYGAETEARRMSWCSNPGGAYRIELSDTTAGQLTRKPDGQNMIRKAEQ